MSAMQRLSVTTWIRVFVSRLAGTIAPQARRGDDDLAQELRHHHELLTEQFEGRGLARDEAAAAARRVLGGVAQTQAIYHERRGFPLVEACLQDIRYALRQLRRQPSFSGVALITLALGIGVNTAIFSIVDAVLLRPLPYERPERLVQFHPLVDGAVRAPFQDGPTFQALRAHLRAYHAIASSMIAADVTIEAARASSEPARGVRGGREPIRASLVTADYFQVLGSAPALGRAFRQDEEATTGTDVAIISHALWVRVFGRDASVLARTVELGGLPHQIVGVMPESFVTRPRADVWLPLRPGTHDAAANRLTVARLREGVTAAQAQRELDAFLPSLWRDLVVPADRRHALQIRPYQSDAGQDVRTPLLVLLGTTVLVLLIACGNVANLLLARAAVRRTELAVRATLGASRARLIRQLLIESLVLSLAGGLLGCWLARLATPALLAISPVRPDFWGPIAIDARVLAFALLLATATGVLFGVMPAWQATRFDASHTLRDGSRTQTGSRGRRLRHALIVAEIAGSMVLLCGALLLVQTFRNLMTVDPGFDPRRVLVGRLSSSGARHDTTREALAFYRAGLDRLHQLPMVERAAVVLNTPMTRGMRVPFVRLGAHAGGRVHWSEWAYVTPGYFDVMRARLRAGRGVTDRDGPDAPPIAVVNEAFGRTILQGASPIGERIELYRPLLKDTRVHEIVGVVADMKQGSLSQPAEAMIYVPLVTVPDEVLRVSQSWFAPSWVIRGRDDGPRLSAVIERETQAGEPRRSFTELRTMTSLVEETVTLPRFHALLIGASALLAMTLAAAGIFGLVAYVLAQRTRELGLRLALGATSRRLLGTIVAQGIVLAIGGIALGAAGALALSRVLTAFLFGVSATDPTTFAIAAVLLFVVALVATLAPAWRVLRLDPSVALRMP